MINDLDATLRTLISKGLPPVLADQVQISFATPDDQFPHQSMTLPAIDLFLYDIRENLELRSNEVYLDYHGDGTATRTPAPIRIDFSYLVTAWPSESVQVPVEDEHHLLGEVMRVLVRYTHIPKEMLQGELAEQDPILPMVSLQAGRLQSLGEFWQALGGKPKAALTLQVTVSVPTAKPEKVTLVTDKKIKIRMGQGVTP